jgi:hypothetical protein
VSVGQPGDERRKLLGLPNCGEGLKGSSPHLGGALDREHLLNGADGAAQPHALDPGEGGAAHLRRRVAQQGRQRVGQGRVHDRG